eukprot:TRINITY_DN51545_c0_g1_i1.p1 TRINITY_DN51545_c0_g1~~TRINITY_DN51545_c0_g1_i1.p1  ORF type:complete len:873 (+),score=153.46 TRINITY_DN51545_c0_g1_i1:75-2693(+)
MTAPPQGKRPRSSLPQDWEPPTTEELLRAPLDVVLREYPRFKESFDGVKESVRDRLRQEWVPGSNLSHPRVDKCRRAGYFGIPGLHVLQRSTAQDIADFMKGRSLVPAEGESQIDALGMESLREHAQLSASALRVLAHSAPGRAGALAPRPPPHLDPSFSPSPQKLQPAVAGLPPAKAQAAPAGKSISTAQAAGSTEQAAGSTEQAASSTAQAASSTEQAASFAVGDRVEAQWHGQWHRGRIGRVDPTGYRVLWDVGPGEEATHTDDVQISSIRRLPEHAAPSAAPAAACAPAGRGRGAPAGPPPAAAAAAGAAGAASATREAAHNGTAAAFARLQQERREMEERVHALEASNKQLQDKVSQLTADLSSARKKAPEPLHNMAQIAAVKRERELKQQLRDQHTRFEQERDEALAQQEEEHERALQKEVAFRKELEAKLAEIEKRFASNSTLMDAQIDAKVARGLAERREEWLTEHNMKLNSLQDDKNIAEREKRVLCRRVADAESKLGKAARELEDLRKQQETLRKQLEELHKQKEAAEAAHKKEIREKNEIQKQLVAENALNERRAGALEREQTTKQRLEEQLAAEHRRSQEHEGQLDTLLQKIRELEASLTAAAGERQTAEAHHQQELRNLASRQKAVAEASEREHELRVLQEEVVRRAQDELHKEKGERQKAQAALEQVIKDKQRIAAWAASLQELQPSQRASQLAERAQELQRQLSEERGRTEDLTRQLYDERQRREAIQRDRNAMEVERQKDSARIRELTTRLEQGADRQAAGLLGAGAAPAARGSARRPNGGSAAVPGHADPPVGAELVLGQPYPFAPPPPYDGGEEGHGATCVSAPPAPPPRGSGGRGRGRGLPAASPSSVADDVF